MPEFSYQTEQFQHNYATDIKSYQHLPAEMAVHSEAINKYVVIQLPINFSHAK